MAWAVSGSHDSNTGEIQIRLDVAPGIRGPVPTKTMEELHFKIDHEVAHSTRPQTLGRNKDGKYQPHGWAEESHPLNKWGPDNYVSTPHEMDANAHALASLYKRLSQGGRLPSYRELIQAAPPYYHVYQSNPDLRRKMQSRLIREGIRFS